MIYCHNNLLVATTGSELLVDTIMVMMVDTIITMVVSTIWSLYELAIRYYSLVVAG